MPSRLTPATARSDRRKSSAASIELLNTTGSGNPSAIVAFAKGISPASLSNVTPSWVWAVRPLKQAPAAVCLHWRCPQPPSIGHPAASSIPRRTFLARAWVSRWDRWRSSDRCQSCSRDPRRRSLLHPWGSTEARNPASTAFWWTPRGWAPFLLRWACLADRLRRRGRNKKETCPHRSWTGTIGGRLRAASYVLVRHWQSNRTPQPIRSSQPQTMHTSAYWLPFEWAPWE